MVTKYHIFRIRTLAPPSESDSLFRESTRGQGLAWRESLTHVRKFIQCWRRSHSGQQRGVMPPFFLPRKAKTVKKSPEKRAHLEKATLHHCDRGTPSCQRRGDGQKVRIHWKERCRRSTVFWPGGMITKDNNSCMGGRHDKK